MLCDCEIALSNVYIGNALDLNATVKQSVNGSYADWDVERPGLSGGTHANLSHYKTMTWDNTFDNDGAG